MILDDKKWDFHPRGSKNLLWFPSENKDGRGGQVAREDKEKGRKGGGKGWDLGGRNPFDRGRGQPGFA